MPLIKTLIFTVLVPGSVTILFPYLLVSSGLEFLTVALGPIRWLGSIPIVVGALTYLWCAGAFAIIGRGTPAPIDPPKTLVIRGPYRFVRNPMYVGVALVLVGEAMLFESAMLFGYTVLVVLGFHLAVLFYEEPTLRRQFGDSYEQYCRSVSRWIPSFRGSDKTHG